jgi:hypothetical protein
MFQFNIVFGILIAYLSNSLLGGIGENAWSWMLGVETVPALLFTLLGLGLPESPRWLIVHNKNREAGLNVLQKVNTHFSKQAKIIRPVLWQFYTLVLCSFNYPVLPFNGRRTGSSDHFWSILRYDGFAANPGKIICV